MTSDWAWYWEYRKQTKRTYQNKRMKKVPNPGPHHFYTCFHCFRTCFVLLSISTIPSIRRESNLMKIVGSKLHIKHSTCRQDVTCCFLSWVRSAEKRKLPEQITPFLSFKPPKKWEKENEITALVWVEFFFRARKTWDGEVIVRLRIH